MAEYTDYKSGKEISREQYIANGLERGELLAKLKCGCVIIQDRTADAYIVYCHKHNAAPDLYEACHIAINEIERLAMVTGYEGEAHYPRIAQIKQAQAKADGG